ncbi:MAG: septum formation initiator [Verrucomicrobia bacterium]|nr:septum formation initiator [Verrucomicrobiota bacterium]
MKRQISFAIILFSSLGAFAQVTQEDLEKEIKPLTQKVTSLQAENSKLKSEIGTLNSKLSNAHKSIDSLRSQTQENSNAISQTANELGIKIKETGDKNEGKITEVQDSLSKNSLYGIIGVLSAILLSGLLYWLLRRRQQTDKTDFIDQLSKTKSSIEESLVKEFGKQTELMDSQLHLIEQQKTTLQATPNAEPDHSLALKVASEINLIERNINLMDSKTKGLKQLQASVGKLKDNLSANGYEMPELLGKAFNQGMRVIVATSIPDENLEKGQEIITKILIPQVNYNDKMIQTAQIEVSVGY